MFYGVVSRPFTISVHATSIYIAMNWYTTYTRVQV